VTQLLDMDQICFDENGRPTAYFEDLWAQLVEDLGGETTNFASEAFELANFPIESAVLLAQVARLRQRIEALEP